MDIHAYSDRKVCVHTLRYVANYHCRDIVNASHLTPLDRQDLYGGKRSQPWNPLSRKLEPVATEEAGSAEWIDAPPTNAQELIRQWRKFESDSAQQYQ